jgi:hypothetical protein
MSAWPDVIELKGYTPKPGDVLFVRVDPHQAFTTAALHDIQRAFEKAVPGVKVLILSGLSVEVPA